MGAVSQQNKLVGTCVQRQRISTLCLWVVNKTTLSWLGTAGKSVQKRFASRSNLLGLECLLCAFQQGTKHGAQGRREVRVVVDALLMLLAAEGFCCELKLR